MAIKTITIIGNRDTGSVHMGSVGAKVGDQIMVGGEAKPRTITYTATMRNGDVIAYCKGSGPFPLGDFKVDYGTEEKPAQEQAA